MPYGYNSKILRVDLSKRKFDVDGHDELFYRRYLGGRGIAAYYLLKELKRGIDPLGPDNLLIFASSVVSGAPLPGASRYTVAAKSPLTNGYAETEAGGFWGPELKFAGYDAIVFNGRASNPVYLCIRDGKPELRDATKLWGKTTGEAQDAIREELQDKLVRVAAIGPGGENLVRYACIMNDLNRANGRTGMGAVMGSKNLKAIGVRGHSKITMKNPETVMAIAKYFAGDFMKNLEGRQLHDYGTPAYVLPNQEAGMLPTRNFQESQIDDAENISGERMKEEIVVRAEGCYSCPQSCKKAVAFDKPYKVEARYGGPEYETIAALGSCCGITDLHAVAKGNELCNKYGLDTMSAGVAISFAMECYQKGILTKADFNGVELKFGNAAAMLESIERIAYRRGYGDLLAEGVMRAAQKMGKGSEKYAMHVKGMELPQHEVRGKVGCALAYAVAPQGADHVQHEHDGVFDPNLAGYDAKDKAASSYFIAQAGALGINEPMPSLDFGPKKVRLFTYLQHWWSLFNMLGLCLFAYVPVRSLTAQNVVDFTRAITGWETSVWELMKAGERGTTMARVFNLKEGLRRKDDNIPDRFYEPIASGPLKGEKIDRKEFEDALSLYYEMMGWDSKNGVPTRGRLEELELGWLWDSIKQLSTQ